MLQVSFLSEIKHKAPTRQTGGWGLALTGEGCARAAYPNLQSGRLVLCFLARGATASWLCIIFHDLFSRPHIKKRPTGILSWQGAVLDGYCRYPRHKQPSLPREGFLHLGNLGDFSNITAQVSLKRMCGIITRYRQLSNRARARWPGPVAPTRVT